MWFRYFPGKGRMSNLKPFSNCRKAEIYEKNHHRYCSKWVCAQDRPELWPAERIEKACNKCNWHAPTPMLPSVG